MQWNLPYVDTQQQTRLLLDAFWLMDTTRTTENDWKWVSLFKSSTVQATRLQCCSYTRFFKWCWTSFSSAPQLYVESTLFLNMQSIFQDSVTKKEATEGKTNWDNLHVINLKGTILPVESFHGLKSGDVILVVGRAHIYSVHFAERLRSRG